MESNRDMARRLWGLAKHNPCVNHQENKLLHDAAQRLEENAATIEQLRRQVVDLLRRLSAEEDDGK